MAEYVVGHAYAAFTDGRQLGPWVAGDVVDVSDQDATFVVADSPGALRPVGEPKELPDPADEPEQAPEDAAVDPDGEPEPVQNRAHRGGRKRQA